jgi:hypothetical protein
VKILVGNVAIQIRMLDLREKRLTCHMAREVYGTIIIRRRIKFGYGSSQEGHQPPPPACGAVGKGANKGRRDRKAYGADEEPHGDQVVPIRAQSRQEWTARGDLRRRQQRGSGCQGVITNSNISEQTQITGRRLCRQAE